MDNTLRSPRSRMMHCPNPGDSRTTWRQKRDHVNTAKDHAKIQKSIEAAVTSLGWLGRKIAREGRNVSMTSEKLASPIQYDLVYERQAP